MHRSASLIRRLMTSVTLVFWLAYASALVAAVEELPLTLSRAGDASLLAESEVRRIVRLRLEGTVYGVDAEHKALALRDDSGFIWLEGLSSTQTLEPGMRIVVEGTGALGNGQALLQAVPLVEQEGARGNAERTGSIHLKAGRHLFELIYAQEAGGKSLNVFYEGLKLARTNIPASALFCSDSTNGRQIVPGIKFECYEGIWAQMPDFSKLKPVSSGITTNFSVGISGRETNFAVRFSGFVEMPEEGSYQFTVAADDSVRLSLAYEAASRIEVAGRDELLPPQRLAPGQAWENEIGLLWAEAEGTVKSIGRHAGRLQMELSFAQTGRMRVTVAAGTDAVMSLLLNSRIRARGLARNTLSPAGEKLAGELLVPSMNEITMIQAAEVLWLLHPVSAISNLTAAAALNVPERIVHLQGKAVGVAGEKYFLLEDGTGRIRVQMAQALPMDLTGEIEVLGQLITENGALTFRSETYRPVAPLAPGSVLPVLTTIEQVRRLKPSQAALHFPVKVRGVVTFVFSGGQRAHIQGASEAVYVSGLSTSKQMLRVGDLCEFNGFTSAGSFSPVLTYRTATILGRGTFPEPLHPTWEQLMNGSLDSHWVEVQGVVQGVTGKDLLIGMRDGQITARFFHEGDADLQYHLDAVVRVRGTVRPIANRQRQVQSVQIQVASPLQLTVDQQAPGDPFAAPFKLVSELREFDPGAASFQRVKTTGQIVHVRNGIGYLMDGTNGMRFPVRENTQLSPGERVEVVGFPEIMGASPVLQQALVRHLGSDPLPVPHQLTENDLMSRFNDSTLIRVDATLEGFHTNNIEQLLELQIGPRIYQARLNHRSGQLLPMSVGSKVQLTGTYVALGLDGADSTTVQSFELLLNSPSDVIVVGRPSWWTLGHVLVVVGGMALVLAMAFGWITLLRRQVDSRTRELQDEIEERKRMELEVERIHRQLVDASRQAGQAEVASSVLHNVGNVLNSVNVSAGLITARLQKLRVASVSKAAALLQPQNDEVGRFLIENEKGRQLPKYLEDLGRHLTGEQGELLKETSDLTKRIDHIKEIVAMQQTYARVSGVTEIIAPSELVENAFKMHSGAFVRHGVRLEREFAEVPPVTVDKHRVLQILVNLLHNAKNACDEGDCAEKRVKVRIDRAGAQRVKIEVADNGVGIAPENLTRIFGHGFTTRKNGHGFGLHCSALAAKELGGSLTAQSDGTGHGAKFTLEIPIGDHASSVITNGLRLQ